MSGPALKIEGAHAALTPKRLQKGGFSGIAGVAMAEQERNRNKRKAAREARLESIKNFFRNLGLS